MANKGKRLTEYLADYVVFDLETTGISKQWDEIIEISAIKVKDHRIIEEFSTLVNPGRPIPAGATAVNGITDEMVLNAPGRMEAISDFLSFVGDQVLVGHNIHSFDLGFIERAAREDLGRELFNDYVDTLPLARRCLPQLSHHRLVDVSAYFHIETEGAHRALNDCVMNQKCYEELGKLLEMQPKEPERICPVCGNRLVKRSGRFGAFYGCEGFPACRFTQKA